MQLSSIIQLDISTARKYLPRFCAASILIIFAWITPSPALGSQPSAPQENSVAQATDEATAFAGSVRLMAHELTTHLADPNPDAGELSGGIAVCSFVDLKKLSRTSSFGRYLAEQLMGELQQRGYSVIEMRKTTSFKIQEKRGEYSLSRNPEEINRVIKAGSVLTGTYTPAGDSVLVNAKIINNRTSTMVASATLIFPRNKLVAALLSDKISTQSGKRDVMYMKRLEL